MKKNLIALLLAVVMAAGSIGFVPVMAAETTAQEAELVQEETDETTEEETDVPATTEEASEGETVQSEEEVSIQEEEKNVEETEQTEEKETAEGEAIIEEEAGTKEEEVTDEDQGKETDEPKPEDIGIEDTEVMDVSIQKKEEASAVVASGSCGNNANWTLTGVENDYTLTISGSGEISSSFVPWLTIEIYQGRYINSVVIEDGITRFSDTFANLSYLRHVTIADTVEYIGEKAFYKCSQLESIKLPNSLTSIEYCTFSDCSSLTSVTIPDGVTSIMSYAFSGCSSLTSLTIPDSVTGIKGFAFSGCSNLTTLTIGNGVTSIEQSAFRNCSSLTSVTIPDSVTEIQFSVFSGCSNLTTLTIGNGLTSIGSMLFSYCSNLTSIYFSGNAPTFRADTFYDLTTTAYYPANDPTWTDDVRQDYDGTITWVPWDPMEGGAIADGTCGPDLLWALDNEGTLTISGTGGMDDYDYGSTDNLPPWHEHSIDIKRLVIQDGVTTIGNSAFGFLSMLNDVVLPDSVTVIGKEAFIGCPSLKEISLPSGVKQLKEGSFREDRQLRKIFLPDSIELIEENAFLNDNITHICYGGDKNAWLDIITYGTGNGAIDYLNAKVHFNARDINDFPQKDWWGFSNSEVTKNHHIDRYMWLSVLGTNIINKYSGWYFGDEDTKDGLCAGMADTAMLFDQDFIRCADFEQETAPAKVNDLTLNAYNRAYDMTAEEMIKLSFILQYIPEFNEKIYSTNVNQYDDLCSAVRQYANSNQEPVYVCLQGPDGNHALWAYAIEEESEYCDIYLYDCNDPDYPQIVRFFGSENSFTGFQYLNPENTHPFTSISYASNINDVELAIATYHQISPAFPLVSIKDIGFVIVAVDDGITYLKDSFRNLIPIKTANGDDDSAPELYYCRTENVVSLCNNEETEKIISFTDDVSSFEFALPQNASADFKDNRVDAHYSEDDALSGTYTTVSGEDAINIGLSGNASEDIQFDFSGNELIVSGQTNLGIDVEYNDTVTSTQVNVSDGGAIHITTDDTDEDNVKLVVSTDADNDGVCEESNVYDLSGNQVVELSEENVQIAFEAENTVNNDANNPQYLFTGKAIEPKPVVSIGNAILVENMDYSLSYQNNTNSGSASIIIEGIGSYTGTITKTFLILPGASKKVTCTNLADCMKVEWVKVPGATQYKVYRDNKLIKTTSGLVIGDKDVRYEVGKKFTYKVVATNSIAGDSTVSRTGTYYRLLPVGVKTLTSPSAGKLKVTYGKCEGCYGYVVRYGKKSDMSDSRTLAVKGANTLTKTLNVEKGKTYYVQVRTYMLVNGTRYFSTYSRIKSVKIK